MAAMHGQAVGVSAVSRAVTDAMWKHTWSLSYVLPAEVLWYPPFDPRDKAEALKIKELGGGGWGWGRRCCHSLVTCGEENKGKENRNSEWQKAGVALEVGWGQPATSRLMSLEEWAGLVGGSDASSSSTPALRSSVANPFFDLCPRFLIWSTRWKFLINVNVCLSFIFTIEVTYKKKTSLIYLCIVYLFERQRHRFFAYCVCKPLFPTSFRHCTADRKNKLDGGERMSKRCNVKVCSKTTVKRTTKPENFGIQMWDQVH